jgi:hypothetical protein
MIKLMQLEVYRTGAVAFLTRLGGEIPVKIQSEFSGG